MHVLPQLSLNRICFIFLLSFFVVRGSVVYAESVQVELLVSVCNANLICEDVIGENYGSCPSDCEPPPPPPPPPVSTTTVSSGNLLAPQGGGGFTTPTIFTNIPALPNQQAPNNTIQASTSQSVGFPDGIQTKPGAVLPELGVDGVIALSPGTNEVVIQFKTFLPSLQTVSWGKTPTFELGSSAEVGFRTNFATKILTLEPGTVYYYRLVLQDSIGRNIEYSGQFTTSSKFTKAPLPAILDFRAREGLQGVGIELYWSIESVLTTLQQEYANLKHDSDPRNDVDSPELYVRLVRSKFGFPNEPMEGKVVYEGRGEHVSDFDVEAGEEYYYSIFVLNQKGQYSSPNIIKILIADRDGSQDVSGEEKESRYYDPLIKDKDAIPLKDLLEAEERLGYCGIPAALQPVFEAYTSADSVYESDQSLLVRFVQENKELELKRGQVIARDDSKVLLRVEGEVLSGAKQLSVCLISNQTGRQNHYLLSNNPDGSFELILPGFFHKNSTKNDYQFVLGMVKSKGEELVLLRGELKFESKQYSSSRTLIYISILLLIIVFGWRNRNRLRVLKIWHT